MMRRALYNFPLYLKRPIIRCQIGKCMELLVVVFCLTEAVAYMHKRYTGQLALDTILMGIANINGVF